MTTMTTIAPKLINMGVLLWCRGGKRGMPDPAEPGGRGWMAEPGAGLLTRTGIRRVSYFSKACLMLPLAWSPRPSAWSASLPATFTG
jgi:hypothetical protein